VDPLETPGQNRGLCAILAAIWVVLPFLWAILNSFKTLEATFSAGAIIPFVNFQPTLDSWVEVLSDPQSINSLISSAVVSAGTTLPVLVLGTPAAYSLARFEFKWRSRDIALWFLSQRVMPPVVVLVPFYILMVQLRLIDTWGGLILLYSAFNLAFCVVISSSTRVRTDTRSGTSKAGISNRFRVFWMQPKRLDHRLSSASTGNF
jgi:multiple sugar transport system permease protein